jgi:hypothetical protein
MSSMWNGWPTSTSSPICSGRTVDLASKNSLHPLLWDHVLSEARLLHAA